MSLNTVLDKIKNKVLIISNNVLEFLQAKYVRTIFIFFIIILTINLILIFNGHFDSEPAEGEEKFKRTVENTFVDGVYFTTTQMSTIGYGDITAKTDTAKYICSLVHIFIIAVSLKLFSEFGIMNIIDKEIENTNKIAKSTPEGKKITQEQKIIQDQKRKSLPYEIGTEPLLPFNLINSTDIFSMNSAVETRNSSKSV